MSEKKTAPRRALSIRDRVVELRRVGRGEVLPNPNNFRTHPEPQRAALRGILKEVGIAGAGLAYYSERNGGRLTFIDGHLRDEEIPANFPVLITDLSDAEADLMLATYDPLAAMAGADAARLDSLLRDVSTGDAALQEMLSELAGENGLYFGEPKKVEDESEVGELIDRAAELQKKWDTKSGDLYQLGSHRLLIGDCREKANTGRLCANVRATCGFTDPPYNVDYGSNPNPRHRIRGIENDNLGDDFPAFLEAALTPMLENVAGAIYVCMSDKEWATLFGVMEKLRAHWSSTIVWVKDQFVLAPKDYHSKHELIWYGWPKGGKRLAVDDRTQTDVWEFARPKVSDEHPTMKPVGLVRRAIENSSKRGDIVLDIFGGSGTTMVAAEESCRVAYLMEVEPKYAAVTLERMTALGLTPELQNA